MVKAGKLNTGGSLPIWVPALLLRPLEPGLGHARLHGSRELLKGFRGGRPGQSHGICRLDHELMNLLSRLVLWDVKKRVPWRVKNLISWWDWIGNLLFRWITTEANGDSWILVAYMFDSQRLISRLQITWNPETPCSNCCFTQISGDFCLCLHQKHMFPHHVARGRSISASIAPQVLDLKSFEWLNSNRIFRLLSKCLVPNLLDSKHLFLSATTGWFFKPLLKPQQTRPSGELSSAWWAWAWTHRCPGSVPRYAAGRPAPHGVGCQASSATAAWSRCVGAWYRDQLTKLQS